MASMLVQPEITNETLWSSAVRHLREGQIRLPLWGELADPGAFELSQKSEGVGPDEPRRENLWRVHWYNGPGRGERVPVPGHIVLPEALTGVKAPIVVLLGRRFPMIGAHKVLAAYACLVPRLVTGQFDPAEHRAIWPSTGNYCRGGIAISRILGCRGVAVLPEGMSRERFEWLEQWVSDPSDIVKTPGTESNVKEIYDKCAELARDERNVILNQFSEFGNYIIHRYCTGRACESVFRQLQGQNSKLRLAAFVAATGSAGTIAAGDHLKKHFGAMIAAVEASECPTLLRNGYGEHNIQGIGDKHVPLIHNVMNTDAVIGVSDRASDALNYLFGTQTGANYLTRRRKLDPELIRGFGDIGLSGLANIVASIKLAKHFDLEETDAIVTIATDSAELYASERKAYGARHYEDGFDEVNAGELYGRHVEGIADDDVLELTHRERQRIFNLGYYTWVEQQGVSFHDFEARKKQSFWQGLIDSVPAWDRLIEKFNHATSV